jgi:hypothetical protein
MDFSPKLYLCLAFSPNNGAHMGLVDTHNMIINTVLTGFEHLPLLVIKCTDHKKILVIFWFQGDRLISLQ